MYYYITCFKDFELVVVIKAKKPLKRIPKYTYSYRRNKWGSRRGIRKLSNLIGRSFTAYYILMEKELAKRWLTEDEFINAMNYLLEKLYISERTRKKYMKKVIEFVEAKLPEPREERKERTYPILLTNTRLTKMITRRYGNIVLEYFDEFLIFEFKNTYHIHYDARSFIPYSSIGDYNIISIPKDIDSPIDYKELKNVERILREALCACEEELIKSHTEKERKKINEFIETVRKLITKTELLMGW